MDPTEMLTQRIIALGDDDQARAEALGVSRRTITEYKAGNLPRIVRNLLDRGILVVHQGAMLPQGRGAAREAA
jgi:hypothetical protein